MNKLDISENFTIDDIHKVREYNSERRRKMTLEERLDDIKKKADECEKEIDKYRKTQKAI